MGEGRVYSEVYQEWRRRELIIVHRFNGVFIKMRDVRVEFFQYRGKSLGKKLLNFLLWALLWVEFITTKYVDI
jgi:hypothetical protein